MQAIWSERLRFPYLKTITLALCASRLKCIYRHSEQGCQPACAISGQPLGQQEEEIELRRVEIEGKEVVVLIKKS